MSPVPPPIVVSLPARSVETARAEIRQARTDGADVAELRLDRWSDGERMRVAGVFPSDLPLVATLRSRAEGGEGPDTPEERAGVLRLAAALPFRWVDLEAARDLPVLESTPRPAPLGWIVSAHFAQDAPVADVVDHVRRYAVPGRIAKAVIPATIALVRDQLLPALPPASEGAQVVHTTGPSGPLLRAWGRRLGFALVFAAPAEPEGQKPAPPPVEPSQIPVDRLRRFFDSAGTGPLFAVAGHPVGYSRSPRLHHRWMALGRRTGLYVPLDFQTEEEFVSSLEWLREGGFLGLNVTQPYKQSALEAATEVSPGAERAGCANTLTFRNEEIEAENTDLVAISRRLDELRASGEWSGDSMVVVGTGGAARATLAAAQGLHATPYLVGRRGSEVGALARRMGAEVGPPPVGRPVDLVVHATTVGRSPTDSLPRLLTDLPAGVSRVLDWVYAPTVSLVRDWARSRGASYEDGWGLFVCQAAASFGLWWGSEPDPRVLRSDVKEGPCAA